MRPSFGCPSLVALSAGLSARFESAGLLDLDTVSVYSRGDPAGRTPVLHVDLETGFASGQPNGGSGHARSIDHCLGELAQCGLHVFDISYTSVSVDFYPEMIQNEVDRVGDRIRVAAGEE
jgi:hypothetical protein